MGHTPDKKVSDNSETTAATTVKKRPGRVEVDSRGRNVWRWNSNGENESTSVLLKRLDNDALALEPTRKVPKMKPPARTVATVKQATGNAAAAPAAKSGVKSPTSRAAAKPGRPNRPAFAVDRHDPKKGGGFDPYNSR